MSTTRSSWGPPAPARTFAAKCSAIWSAGLDPCSSSKAWAATDLTPIGLHECRHSYAAYMIAAGINSKALSTYMGHSSITITLDRYGHLLPGNENEAAQLLDTWLRNATEPALSVQA